jgi:hypothetical protein
MRSILVVTCLLLTATSVAADVTKKSRLASNTTAKFEACQTAGGSTKSAPLVRHKQAKDARLATCANQPGKGKALQNETIVFAIGVYR